MGIITSVELEERCRATFPKEGDEKLVSDLNTWSEFYEKACVELMERLEVVHPSTWSQIINRHPAAKHRWYEKLRDHADIHIFSAFLAEEAQMPAFVPLLRKVHKASDSQIAKDALNRNIHDELNPHSHSSYFELLLSATKARAEPNPTLDAKLADTNLVYYMGYYVDHWFAIGALYATELMVPWRASNIRHGLKRLGLQENEVAFMTIHAQADIEHAEDWLKNVISPALIYGQPQISRRIVRGITFRLTSSRTYLDRLLFTQQNHKAPIEIGNKCICE